MRPFLCCTVAEPSMSDLCRARDEHARDADIVELRLDYVRGPIDVAQALAGRTAPVIVTCRPLWAGGRFEGSEEERHGILMRAATLGADFVDVEWQAGFDDAIERRRGAGVVLSLHDFDGVPRDLELRVAAMLARDTEVVKVAVSVAGLTDAMKLAELAHRHAPRKLVVIGMGPSGVPTRLLPARFGSCWTYAGGTAPGQITADDMMGVYRFRQTTEATAVYGVAGRPVAASLSPVMHNRFFEVAGIDAVYLPLDAENADDVLRFADWLPLDGVSVTAPLKRGVFDRVNAADRVAARVGAVNTIRRTADGWEATNTDVGGFLAPLAARGCRLDQTRAAILGAGGAARSVAIALRDAKAAVSVHARRLDAAREVAALAGGVASESLPAPGAWDLLVNATPIDWRDSMTRLLSGVGPGAVVYDLISNPVRTPLLVEAKRRGCEAISGIEMLVAQAEAQAEWWTGRRPTPGLMMAAAAGRAKGETCG